MRLRADIHHLADVQRHLDRHVSTRLGITTADPTSWRILDAAYHYHAEAPARGLDWTFPLAQSILETDWMRSPACTLQHNYAGIKNGPSHAAPSALRQYDAPLDGIRDHLDLLAVYSGVWVPDMVDPSRNLRIPQIVDRFPAVFPSDLDGVWAEIDDYSERIERVWRIIVGAGS